MNKDVTELERGHPSGHDVETEPAGRLKFQLLQRGDYIKPGWWHWRCRREDCNGEVAYGFVQADSLGRTVVPDSFEQDRFFHARGTH